jgi:hypothetical protein
MNNAVALLEPSKSRSHSLHGCLSCVCRFVASPNSPLRPRLIGLIFTKNNLNAALPTNFWHPITDSSLQSPDSPFLHPHRPRQPYAPTKGRRPLPPVSSLARGSASLMAPCLSTRALSHMHSPLISEPVRITKQHVAQHT